MFRKIAMAALTVSMLGTTGMYLADTAGAQEGRPKVVRPGTGPTYPNPKPSERPGNTQGGPQNQLGNTIKDPFTEKKPCAFAVHPWRDYDGAPFWLVGSGDPLKGLNVSKGSPC